MIRWTALSVIPTRKATSRRTSEGFWASKINTWEWFVRNVQRATGVELPLACLERGHWRRGSSKDDAIRAAFGMSPTAYYLALSRLIDSPEAAAYDPQLVQRLQRRIAERAARRSGNGP